MAKYFGQAQNAANSVIRAFENGDIPAALSQVFVQGAADKHISGYSFMNRLIVLLHGYSDARGAKQWKKLGRWVKSEEWSNPVHILAPVMRSYKDKDTGEKKSFLIGFKAVRVYGLEQTEGKPIEHASDVQEFMSSLPLIEVAKHWGVSVEAFNGSEHGALGVYMPGPNAIGLGTKNLSTWAHELAHKSDDLLGNLGKDSRALGEVTAEFAGAVLLKCIGYETEADLGGCFEYVKTWAEREGKSVADACYKVVNRVCKIVEHILKTAEEIGVEA